MKNKKFIAAGIIHVHPRGFGFVTPHKEYNLQEDIFIPQRKTLSAVEGDEVEFRYYPERNAKGFEGEVLSILKRSRRHVAGTLASPIGKGEQWYAYIPLFGADKEMIVSVPPDSQKGDRMIFEVTSWGTGNKAAKGKSISFLGHITDGRQDIPAAVEEFELIDTFSEKVVEEISAFGKTVSSKESGQRADFTKLETFTIDPDESKDFDDALSLLVTPSGYTLYVHVADVSYYVRPGTALDKEALARCNSVYFPGGVLPMLPPTLSNHLCSLKPNVKRLAVTVKVELDKEGQVLTYEIMRSVIKSQKRFTYREAKEVLDGRLDSPHKTTLQHMSSVCKLLKLQRAKRGAVEFAMPDLSLKVDKEGRIAEMRIVEYDVTHQLVEEFMLKANELVAITLANQNKPLTYRIHEEPSEEKMRDFVLYARNFGFALSPKPTSLELQEMFDKTRESSFGKSLNTAFIRTMKLAQYSTQNIGHYGLMLEHYTHFTSPIRRYVDLIVHRLLFDDSDPKLDHEQMAGQCSEKERSSARAESSVTLLKKLRHILQLCHEEPEGGFDAVVTAIKPFGVAFDIPAFFMDGLIPRGELSYETYHKLQAGASIRIQVKEIDLIRRAVFWMLEKKPSLKRQTK